jgi:hypothetical protein
MNSTGEKKAEPQTESARILDRFDYNLERLDKLCTNFTLRVTNAVGFDLRPTNEELKEGPHEGNFIFELDGRLSNLQKFIDKLDDIEYNLSRLV